MTAMTTDPRSPEALRAEMVDRIRTNQYVLSGPGPLSARVLETMRTVPRHAFVPDAHPVQAYAEDAVITKRDSGGAALSCVSAPSIVAMMLHHLDVQPGHRILEIGAGTGYNAALLAELAGPAGQVTTIDIDPQVTAAARRALDTTGHRIVRVVTGDGRHGDPDGAVYDRLVVTVGPWDLPPAWWQQLAAGGRMVVPLRWRGQTRAIAFTRHGDRLVSDAVELCGFVPMFGEGQDGERTATLDAAEQVHLTGDIDQHLDPALLRGVLDQPRHHAWTPATVGDTDPFDGIWLRLTATDPTTCRLTADHPAIQAGICDPAIPARSPALAEGGSLAYLTLRPADTPHRWQLGAIGHGPAGPELAARLCGQIHAWNHDRTAQPTITAHPAGTPTTAMDAGQIIDKPRTRLHLAF